MTIHTRLRAARKHAGLKSVAEAARRHGWNVNTMTSNENGNKPYGRAAAEDYARKLKVSLEWLLTGKGEMLDTNESAEIVNIWSRIPEKDRETARRMLASLADEA